MENKTLGRPWPSSPDKTIMLEKAVRFFYDSEEIRNYVKSLSEWFMTWVVSDYADDRNVRESMVCQYEQLLSFLKELEEIGNGES